ncbi:hypothetical protein ACO0M4_07735 [Streptomyces sp. RGM 3693]|uniref:hypothetical protein n=1 Tax=Streptomyces sp. RGM 3693 TaxID=3413284 RepID=UPI003D2DF0FB
MSGRTKRWMVAVWAVLVVAGGVGTLMFTEPAGGRGEGARVKPSPAAWPHGGGPGSPSRRHCPPTPSPTPTPTPTPAPPPTAGTVTFPSPTLVVEVCSYATKHG